jgi:hypothetical protein
MIRPPLAIAVLVLLSSALPLTLGCGRRAAAPQKRIEPVYDKETGKLQLLKYDSDGNGKIDTWSYMDGARVVRIEIDKDEDGKIDRWEYYDTEQKLSKIGVSRANGGTPDAWSYVAPDGSITRVEIATRSDRAARNQIATGQIATGKIAKTTRTEFYDRNTLIRAEEDTDGDGKVDKWETYEGDHVAVVAYDTAHRGFPDQRLVYGVSGSARVEVDQTGSGKFVAVDVNSTRR